MNQPNKKVACSFVCPAMHPKQTVNHTVTKSHVELQTCRAAEARRARNHGQAPCRPVPQLLHASAHSPPCPGGVGHPSGVTPPLASPASMQGLPPHGARRSTLASSDGSAEAPKRPRGRLRGLRDGARRRAAAGRAVGVVAVVGVAVAARAVLVLVVLRRRRAQLLRRLRPAPIRPLSRHDSNGLVRMRMQIAGTDNHYVAVRSMIVLHEASTHTS